jgi:hypothetical protein
MINPKLETKKEVKSKVEVATEPTMPQINIKGLPTLPKQLKVK